MLQNIDAETLVMMIDFATQPLDCYVSSIREEQLAARRSLETLPFFRKFVLPRLTEIDSNSIE